jgi:hypothetical protein
LMVWLFIAIAFASPDDDYAHIVGLEEYRPMRLAQDVPSITESQLRAVLGGEPFGGIKIVEEVAAGLGYGAMLFPVGVEAIWATITDEDELDGELGLGVSAIVGGERYRDGRLLFQTLNLPFPVDDRYWVTKVSHNSPLFTGSQGAMWELSWTDAGVDVDLSAGAYATAIEGATKISWTTGAWLLIPLDADRTLVEYFAWSDPGGSVPRRLASKFVGRQVRATLRNVLELSQKRKKASVLSQMVQPDGLPLNAYRKPQP